MTDGINTQFSGRRNRFGFSVALLLTIVLGLGSRRWSDWLPEFIVNHAGDALWAVAVYILLAIIMPVMRSWKLAVFSLVISFGVEFIQLINMPWLDSLRATLIGKLMLGSGFLWIDLIRYFAGVAGAFLVDCAIQNSSFSNKSEMFR